MNLVNRFSANLHANAGRVSLIHTLSDALPLIESYLAEKNLPPALRLSPSLFAEWPDSSLQLSQGSNEGEQRVCASRAFAGIADTGTLVLLSGPDNPTRLNFLADHHLVFIHARQILADKPAFWQLLQQQNNLPRVMNFISGPSRTADIEQTIQVGAHGPRILWVFVQE